MNFVLCALLVILLASLSDNQPVLTPLKYVAYEGGPGHTFECTLTVPSTSPPGLLVIYVDGGPINTPEQIRRGISLSTTEQLNSTTHYQSINISSLQVNKNTILQCFGFGFGFDFTDGPGVSNNATFRVQGLLDQPVVMAPSEYNDSHCIIRWTGPPTLNITDIEPDFTYRVCNSATGVCINTTEEFFITERMCYPATYSVSACNPVGCGETATVEHPRGPVVVTIIHVEFMYSETQNPVVNITLQAAIACAGQFRSEFEYYVVAGDPTRTERVPLDSVQEGVYHYITLTPNTSIPIVENARYNGMIELGETPFPLLFWTFDVHDVSVVFVETTDSGMNSVNITCTFVRGSMAKGCFVTFNESLQNYTIMKGGSSVQEGLSDGNRMTLSMVVNDVPNGTYTVVAHDIESNNGITTKCEPLQIDVTFPPPSNQPSASSSRVSAQPTPTITRSPTADGSGSTDSSGVIAGGIVAAVILVILAVGGVVATAFIVVRWHKTKGDVKLGIELEENPTYGLPPLPISMEKNSAYVSVTTRKKLKRSA